MDDTVQKIGMTPPHPGSFIREEILDELRLSISQAAEALGVRRATLSDLVNGNAALSPEMALRIEKAFGGHAAAHAGLVRRSRHAGTGR
jgi:addiction module HigA family antidote